MLANGFELLRTREQIGDTTKRASAPRALSESSAH